MAGNSPEDRASRAVVRIFRIGDEPPDDLLGSTTAEERLRILRMLTERAWSLGGHPWPSYSRGGIPVRVERMR
jgi:hypothetical protein